VLATAAGPDDGVEARLAAIHEKNSTFDHSADLDIVYDDDEVATAAAAEEDLGGVLACLGPVLAGVVGVAGTVSGAGVFGETKAAAAAALGQQAAAMVLNLDDLTQCTPEVLEIELDSLDFDQLTMLKQVLDA
jgi:alanine dehydrogenase